MKGAPRRSVVWTALALLVVPIAVDLALGGIRRAFDYLQSDAYYYLVVARNIAGRASVSFDGEHATNGFHPLWQFVLAALYRVLLTLRASTDVVVFASIAAQVAILAVGLVLILRANARLGIDSPWLASLPFGLYGVLVAPYYAYFHAKETRPELYGTLWSYVNGMESSCAICAYGLVALVFASMSWARRRDTIGLGLACALLVLARLDTLFIPAALFAMLAAGAIARRASLRPVVVAGIACAAPIAIYCAINVTRFGGLLPTSGAIKSTFPHVNHANLVRLLACVTAPRAQSLHRLYRIAQLALPLAMAPVAVVVEALRLRTRADEPDRRAALLYVATALGTACTSLYDLLFVELSAQGSWYQPIGTLFVSLYGAVLLARSRLPSRFALAPIALVGVALFVGLQRAPGASRAWADFYLYEAPRLRAFYGDQRPRFLEIDDGIFSFATGYDAMPNFCFVGDPACARETKKGLLIPLAVSRGYDRLTSVLYVPLGQDPRATSAQLCAALLEPRMRWLCDRYHFEVEYAHGPIGVVKATPADMN